MDADSRAREVIVARFALDNEAERYFEVYERQVTAARQVLGPYIDAVVKIGEVQDALSEHNRIINANQVEIHNKVTIELVEEAFLLVQRPIAYTSFQVAHDGRPVSLGIGEKNAGEFIRFNSIQFSASVGDDFVVLPQAEIVETNAAQKPIVYNRYVFNPNNYDIALLDPDTPTVIIS